MKKPIPVGKCLSHFWSLCFAEIENKYWDVHDVISCMFILKENVNVVKTASSHNLHFFLNIALYERFHTQNSLPLPS